MQKHILVTFSQGEILHVNMEKQGKSHTLEMYITAQDLEVSPDVQEQLWCLSQRIWLKNALYYDA